MFARQLSQIYSRPINSFDDVRASMNDLVQALDCCFVEHKGTTRLYHSADDQANSGGSTLTVEQQNDGTNNSQSPFSDSLSTSTDPLNPDQPHALFVKRGSSYFKGPARFKAQASFDVPPAGAIFYGTAAGNWNPATDQVNVTSATLGVVVVNLLRTTAQDPNIRTGNEVLFALADDGNYWAVDSHLDDKIGTVKYWIGSVVPQGWRLMQATGTYDTRNRFIKCSNSATLADLGTTGGSATHSHTVSGSTATGTTGGSGTLTTSGGSAHSHGSGNTGYAQTNTLVVSGSTAYATTGITSTDSTTPSTTVNNTNIGPSTTTTTCATPGAATVLTSITFTSEPHNHTLSGLAHSHTLTEPTNGGAGTGHLHGAGSLAVAESSPYHRHSIADESAHTHTITSHTHSIPALGSGTLAADAANGEPAYLILGVIERFQ